MNHRTAAKDQPERELKDALPRAVYVAIGGELPEFESHFLRYQATYRVAAANVLRTLADFAERTGTEEGWALAVEHREIAEQVEESRE